MAVQMTYHQSAMPEPPNPLPTLREKLASFDGAIGADDIARLLQTSRHTIYLWVRDNKIPYFRLNGCLKFDPALVADWIDSTSSTPKDPAPARKSEPASGSPASKPAAKRSAKPGRPKVGAAGRPMIVPEQNPARPRLRQGGRKVVTDEIKFRVDRPTCD
jgi:hypothetical protein